MKKLFFILFMIGFCVSINAQSTDRNYIEKKTYTTENQTSLSGYYDIEYFDGLGRSIQSTANKAGARRTDIIVSTQYDGAGRPEIKTDPFKDSSSSSSGYYISEPVTEATNYYTNPSFGVVTNTHPYSVSVYEDSPLNRVVEQGFSGEDWQPGQHTPKVEFRNNTCGLSNADNVIKFDRLPIATPLNFTVYPAGTLFKNISYDEDNNQKIVFIDIAGRKILERSVLNGEKVDTYFIYDDFGNTIGILQPEGSNLFVGYCSDFSFSSSKYNTPEAFLFRYYYDDRQRLIKKETSGKYGNTTYFIYDQQNRLRLTTNDELLTDQEWFFYKYDEFDRVILEGKYQFTSPSSDYLNNYFTGPSGTVDDNKILFVKAITSDAMNNNLSSSTFDASEKRSSTIINGIGYTNTSFPTDFNNATILSVKYYDNYDFVDSEIDIDIDPDLTFQNNSSYLNISSRNDNVKGQLTAERSKLLNKHSSINVDWINSSIFYDEKYRIAQNNMTNILGGYDKYFNKYNFLSAATYSTHLHKIDGDSQRKLVQRNIYDHRNRLLQTYLTLDSESKFLSSRLIYNDIGQLVTKGLYYSEISLFLAPNYRPTNSCFLQSIDYRYNERGWLTAINDVGDIKSCSVITKSSDRIALINAIINALPIKKGYRFSNESSDITSINKGTGLQASSLDEVSKSIENTTYREHLSNFVIDSVAQFVQLNADHFEMDTSQIRAEVKSLLNQIYARYTFVDCDKESPDLFAQKIEYNKVVSGVNNTPNYNGNISAISWGSSLNRTGRTFAYEYDHLNRLKKADYFEWGADASNNCMWQSKNNFGVSGIDYDLNGNMTHTLRRRADGSTMDDLDLDYYGNRLIKVRDNAIGAIAGTTTFGFTDGVDIPSYYYNVANDYAGSGNGEYGYDKQGNLNSDLNRGISNITYHHFNLPETITKNGRVINYTYDASGKKQMSWTSLGTKDESKIYTGPFEYKQDFVSGFFTSPVLDAIYHTEGRITPNGSSWQYEYYLKDHLGNNRVVFTRNTSDGRVKRLQENHYYPFGMNIGELAHQESGSKKNNYLYNGKEINSDLGLNWYDYGARMYDPAVGRFMGVDLLADHPNQVDKSPYGYAWNNPILLTDPDGRCPDCPIIFKALDKHYTGGKVGQALEFIVGFTPYAGTVLDVGEALLGEEVFTGNKLSTFDRGVALFPGKLEKLGDLAVGLKKGINKWNGPVDYSDLVDHKSVGPGKNFTRTRKKAILQKNKDANGGILRSDLDGTILDKPVQSKRDAKAKMNQAEVDHIHPKSKGGSNSNSNAQVLSKTQNIDKSDKP